MCGITGIVGRDRTTTAGVLRAMTRALRHRGPDDEGYVCMGGEGDEARTLGGADTPARAWGLPLPYAPRGRVEEQEGRPIEVGLGHRRLAILDLSPAGHQPMCDARRRLWLVYNGEVFNFVELRQELEEGGASFQSDSDTEVLLRAYEKWGPACLERLNGIWAFAVWDRAERTVFLARDRFGVKPLYYVRSSDRFAFASEVKALLAGSCVAPQVCEPMLADYLLHGITDHTEETLFRGVAAVPPGGWVRLRIPSWQMESGRYYRLHERVPSGGGEAPERAAQRVRELLEDSVRIRLASDVPVGTCLSGGLDSGSVVCLIRRVRERMDVRCPDFQHSFSVVYADAAVDETERIRQLASASETKHALETVTPEGFLADVERFLWHQEAPFDKVGVFAQWHVSRMMSAAGVRVSLDGQGGDELFAGYHEYFAAYYGHLLRTGQAAALADELRGFLGRYGWRAGSRMLAPGRGPMGRRAARRLGKWAGARGLCPVLPAEAWVSREFREAHGRDAPPDPPGSERFAGLTQRLYRSLATESIPHALRISDRNAMAHGVEARVPFLDHRLVELAFSLPDRLKIRRGETKHVLREAMRGILPEDVRTVRGKIGFWLPLGSWFRTPGLGSLVAEVCASTSFRQRPFFDAAECERQHRRFLAGGHYPGLWRWVNAELWLRRFIDGGGGGA